MEKIVKEFKVEIILFLIFISVICLKLIILPDIEPSHKIIKDKCYYNEYHKIQKSFRTYNTEIDDTTICAFLDVCCYFDFVSNADIFNQCIAQICYESQARQYKEGTNSILKSSGGAIGICQILPSTAHQTLFNMSKKERKQLIRFLQMKNPSFLEDKNHSKIRNKVIVWLSNPRNSFVLWGYLMNKNYKETKSFSQALYIYNTGSKCKNPASFGYVIEIQKIKNKLK